MHVVDLRKMEFLVFCKIQIISLLKNIGRMTIVDFSQEFTRKETKLTFAKNIQFCKMGKKRLISHKISHIAKTHIFARDFLYGYYYVVICAIYIGQCGGYNIVSHGIVFKPVIISRDWAAVAQIISV